VKYYYFIAVLAICGTAMYSIMMPYKTDIRSDLDAMSNDVANMRRDVIQMRTQIESMTIQVQVGDRKAQENFKRLQDLIEKNIKKIEDLEKDTK